MKDNKFFTIGLLVSMALHSVILVNFFKTKQELKELEKQKKELMEVREIEFEKKKEVPIPVSAQKFKEKVNVKNEMKEASKRGVAKVPLVKDTIPLPNHFKAFDRKPQKLKGMKVERQVAVPVLKSGKINSPAYVTYYQIVRDRIRQKAYSNYVQLKSGDVYMTFILLANGQLKELKVDASKTSDNEYLKEVGLQSVSEASPFPAFPEDLKYPELTFNVVISFQFSEEEEE